MLTEFIKFPLQTHNCFVSERLPAITTTYQLKQFSDN